MSTSLRDKSVPKKPDEILREIETKLATIDGISTSDAFALGGLCREYGNACAGEVSSSFMAPLLDILAQPRPPKDDERWR